MIKWGPYNVTDEDVAEMRAWIADCGFLENEPDGATVDDLTDVDVIDGVCRHYSGSIQGWYLDGEYNKHFTAP